MRNLLLCLKHLQYCIKAVPFIFLFIHACESTSCSHNIQGSLQNLNKYIILPSNDVDIQFLWRFLNVKFYAFDRLFSIELLPKESLVSNKMKIRLSKGDPFDTNKIKLSTFYNGIVIGEVNSYVLGHIGPSGSLYLTIEIPSNTFVVEPMSYYNECYTNKELIIYRASDIKNFTIPSKNMILPKNMNASNILSNERKSRSKRWSARVNKYCGIHLVADYTFFKKIGGADHAKTVDLLLASFEHFNRAFLATELNYKKEENMQGFGFYLTEIDVHTAPRKNQKKLENSNEVLIDFGTWDLPTACIHHLFTAYSDKGGVLGLSWLAFPEYMNPGGACSKSTVYEGTTLQASTSYSSYLEPSGALVVGFKRFVLTTHELGHSWGAQHDPNTTECQPTTHKGGYYLMHPIANSGEYPNNMRFSPCSRSQMSVVVSERAAICFETPTAVANKLCGNSRLDDGEECDPGLKDDQCCSKKCKLNSNAMCSPRNHECCTKMCEFKPEKTPCAVPSSATPCLAQGSCSGSSGVCSGPLKLNGTRCHEHGMCNMGRCDSYCNSIFRGPCTCNQKESSCYVCCLITIKINGEPERVCQAMPIFPPFPTYRKEFGILENLGPDWELRQLTQQEVQLTYQDKVKNTSHVSYLVYSKGARIPPPGEQDSVLKMLMMDGRPCLIGKCQAGGCIKVHRNGPLLGYKLTGLHWGSIVGIVLIICTLIWTPMMLLLWRYNWQLQSCFQGLLLQCRSSQSQSNHESNFAHNQSHNFIQQSYIRSFEAIPSDFQKKHFGLKAHRKYSL